MAECSEIRPMLGAFEDSELEPNEMQEVAFHLARCESCAGVLADYSAVGRELRSLAVAPMVPGFANAVVARIDRLPQPLLTRIDRFFGRGWDLIGAGFAWGGAVAAVAILTAIIITPYAQRLGNGGNPAATLASNQLASATSGGTIADEPTMDGDSQAVISRLESGNPAVAVWSEPRKDTTVIWLPDQP